MIVDRKEALARLDAAAELLSQGPGVAASGLDIDAARRISDAAVRIHETIDWANWPAPEEAANSLAWLRDALETFVMKHWVEAGQVPQRSRECVNLENLVEEAAALWVGSRSSWVPDEVVDHLQHGLLMAGWKEDHILGQRDTLMARARVLRDDLRADKSSLAAARSRAATRTTRIAGWQASEEERALAERVHAADLEAARRRQEIAAARERDEIAREQAKRQSEAERGRAVILAEAGREALERHRTRSAPAPPPQPFGVSAEGAEHLVAMWMRHLGVLDAEVTRFSGDGGIDVVAAGYVAQVKNIAGFVPIQDVRALFGVAASDDKRGLLFTSGTLTSEGFAFANRVGLALFHYDAVAGTLAGLNEIGKRAVDQTIAEGWK
ncbi:restriction endonuclease [Microbacterium sp. SSW1-59]|uniref:restriction endonuclease n=1 Tax=Microbacterium xanthum TaxID=3079794 RepID=UPI002AD4395A|nr:restriction endonuclease [Microbacterium sp. SSW1-59]MDZ8199935.1 restriction endonuclease [Microbacterium sp. SSW1-59]